MADMWKSLPPAAWNDGRDLNQFFACMDTEEEEWIVKAAQRCLPGVIVDIGCGTGLLLSNLARRVVEIEGKSSTELFGCDVNPTFLAEASKKVKAVHGNAHFLNIDITKSENLQILDAQLSDHSSEEPRLLLLVCNFIGIWDEKMSKSIIGPLCDKVPCLKLSGGDCIKFVSSKDLLQNLRDGDHLVVSVQHAKHLPSAYKDYYLKR